MKKTYKIPRVGELLTKRPEGMSYEEYRKKRTEQKKMLKGRVLTRDTDRIAKFLGLPKSPFHHLSAPGRVGCAVCIPPKEWVNSQTNKVVFV